MATIIKATDAVFTSKNMPNITKYGYTSQGLVSLYRPKSGVNGLRDLSGNNKDLKIIGQPKMKADGAIVDSNNGFELDGVVESPNFTWIIVGKTKAEDLTTIELLMYNRASAVADDGYKNAFFIRHRGAVDAPMIRTVINTATGNETVDFSALGTDLSNYYFLALSIDTASNTATLYDGVKDKSLKIVLDGAIAGKGISDDYLTIGFNGPDVTNAEESTLLLEAAVFNRALSESELEQQFLLSSSYLYDHYGIRF